MDRIYRLNMVNSISGYKPANLIGTRSESGRENVAIFSSVVHLGSDPALLGFIMRPTTVERHTYDNVIKTKSYTINHVPDHLTDMAHYSSAKFDDDTAEFDVCSLIPEYIDGLWAPFVADAPVRMGMRFIQEIPIEINGTIMIIGSVEHLHIREHIIEPDGALNLESAGSASVSGLNTYYSSRRIAKYPYARVGQRPVNLIS